MKKITDILVKHISNAYRYHVKHKITVNPIDIVSYIQEKINYELTDGELTLLKELVYHSHVQLILKNMNILLENESGDIVRLAKKIKKQSADLLKKEKDIINNIRKLEADQKDALEHYKQVKNDGKKRQAAIQRLKDIQANILELQKNAKKIRLTYEEIISDISSNTDLAISSVADVDDREVADDFGRNF
jgi:hypothetical protein